MADDPRLILVVEDSETKWRDISDLLSSIIEPALNIVRAATMEQAIDALGAREFDLVLLDISLDIRLSETGPKAGGHDTVGGLRLAERMYYLGEERPTIVVTAFDAFPARNDRGSVVIGIDDVVKEAQRYLGKQFRGWVRYGDPDWQDRLKGLIKGALNNESLDHSR